MKPIPQLSEYQVAEIQRLAQETRHKWGYVETPVAPHLLDILEKMQITLLQLPIQSDSNRPAFSAALLYIEENGEEFAFLGLNTADYFDKQLFAIAHELYHYLTKTGSHLSRIEEETKIIEVQANRFAAEFLLPQTALERLIIQEFKTSSLHGVSLSRLLRFIARLHCTWWLPYRSLVRRLKETAAISDSQYKTLYGVDERDLHGDYGRLGMAINDVVFPMLNRVTKKTGVSQDSLELIIQNYEDYLIGDDRFAELLHLFGKSPTDFGYDLGIYEEDIREFEQFFGGEVDDESQSGVEESRIIEPYE